MEETQAPKRPNRIALDLPAPLRRRLDRLTDTTGRKRSHLIVEAVQRYVETEERTYGSEPAR